MFKKILAVLLSGLLLLSFVACSSSTSTGGKDSKEDTTSEGTQPEPVTLKPVTLSLGLPGGYGITSEKIVQSFKEKYDYITLEIDEAPWGDFTTKIATQIAGGTAPDVWFQENAAIIGYGSRGVAEDLMPYINRDLNVGEFAEALFAARKGDKVWGIPHGANPIALAYNKTLFDEAGIPYPTDDWTFDDLIDAAVKLTKRSSDEGPAEVYGMITSTNITQGWFPWIKSTGGKALDETLTKAQFTDPKTIEGITKWAAMSQKLKVSPTPAEIKEYGNAIQMFGNGKAAMYFIQYAEAQSIINVNFPDFDYDVVMIPKASDGNRYVPNVINCWVIYSKSKQEEKDAAWEWIKHFLSAESQDIVAESGGSLPVRKSSLEKLEAFDFKPLNKKAFTKGIDEAGITMDENPSWNEWRTVAQPIFNDIFDGKISPEEGLKEIQEKVQKVLDEQ